MAWDAIPQGPTAWITREGRPSPFQAGVPQHPSPLSSYPVLPPAPILAHVLASEARGSLPRLPQLSYPSSSS